MKPRPPHGPVFTVGSVLYGQDGFEVTMAPWLPTCHAIDGAERELRGSSEATIYRAAVSDHDKLRAAPAASRRRGF